MAEPQRNKNAPFDLTLGVIAQVPHWVGSNGTPWAYEPYVREMRVWADLFARVRICATPGEGPMKLNLAPYDRPNVIIDPVPYCLGSGLSAIRKRFGQLPGMIGGVHHTILESDFVLVRSPNHFALVGATLARWLRRPSITKWAGENGAYAGERFPIRLNRYLENGTSRRHPVLVYGPAKQPHQVSFLPALMQREELAQARQLAAARKWSAPWKILGVGRLEPVKGFDLAIRGLAALRCGWPDLSWHFTLIGDGTGRQELQSLCARCGILDRVTFTGSLPFHEVQRHYAAAHVAIMPGVKEGWPKIIAEAWAHGAIPVAAAAGLVPWILKDDGAGVIFEPNPTALAAAVGLLLRHPARMREISGGLFPYAESLSLDQFKLRLKQVLIERCGLGPEPAVLLPSPARVTVPRSA